jgi:Mg-chelatase subunit ChlD
MQAALDATALAMAREPATLSETDFKTKARAFFDANFKGGDQAALTTFNVTRTAATVHMDVAANVKTTLLSIAKIPTMPVTASGDVLRGAKKVEVVLALDNTGSMGSSGKIAALRTAATNLVDILAKSQTESGQVKIGLVPFSTSVRVDPTSTFYKNATWIDFTSGNGSTGTYTDYNDCEEYSRYGGCRRYAQKSYSDDDVKKSSWQGCLNDRVAPYNTNDTGVDPSNLDTMYTALQNCRTDESKLTMVQPLSSNFSTLKSQISTMVAGGNTNVTIGVAWGQALLSQQAPFTEGVAYGTKDVQKFLIVLTDGENTQDRFDSCGGNSCVTRMDNRTLAACDSAKAQKITIYTIRVIDGNGEMLKSCATDSSKYFDVSKASELDPVFQGIANQIATLRLTS